MCKRKKVAKRLSNAVIIKKKGEWECRYFPNWLIVIMNMHLEIYKCALLKMLTWFGYGIMVMIRHCYEFMCIVTK